MQLLQAVEPSCVDPLVVIYHTAPISALTMVPMSLIDILGNDIRGIEFTYASIVEVVLLVAGTGIFSFGLIFAEVSRLPVWITGYARVGQPYAVPRFPHAHSTAQQIRAQALDGL